MRKQFLKTIMSMAMLLGSNMAFSQPIGEYGNGSDGPWPVSGTEYSDNSRARVLSYDAAMKKLHLSLTMTDVYNFATITAGDYVLIVQMEGGTIGAYDMIRVTTTTNIATEVSITLNSGLTFAPSFAGSDRVQVMLVKEHTTVDIGLGAEVTCHAWDGATGGILCFMCDGMLTITADGHITANQKGHLNPTGGGTGGAGASGITNFGAGATGGNGNSGTGGTLTGERGTDAMDVASNGVNCDIFPFIGGQGTLPLGTPTAGTAGGAGTSHPAAVDRTLLIVGDAGDAGAGGTGGKQGGNGGGGASSSGGTNAGQNGQLGDPGGTGGNGGTGGRGAGLVYIRCSDINVVPGVLITANGGAGSNGTGASMGGQGGDGGDGGDMALNSCGTTIEAAGGGGGKGYTADGADGGGGGSGGEHGFIYVYFENTCNMTLAQLQMLGGDKGYGGGGALPTTLALWGGAGAQNLGACFPASQFCPQEITVTQCNCKRAFEELANLTDRSTAGGIYDEFALHPTGPVGSETYARWYHTPTSGDAKLVAYVTTSSAATPTAPSRITHTQYECKIKDDVNEPDGYQFMQDLSANFSQGTITGSTTITWDVDAPLSHEANYNSGSEIVTLDDHVGPYVTNGDGHYETEECDVNTSCTGDCPVKGADGPDGTKAPDGGPGDGVIKQERKMMKRGLDVTPILVNELGISLYPNPANKDVNFSLTSDIATKVDIVITDITGKQVIVTNYDVTTGENVINIEIAELPKGTYTAVITSQEGRTSVLKFVVE